MARKRQLRKRNFRNRLLQQEHFYRRQVRNTRLLPSKLARYRRVIRNRKKDSRENQRKLLQRRLINYRCTFRRLRHRAVYRIIRRTTNQQLRLSVERRYLNYQYYLLRSLHHSSIPLKLLFHRLRRRPGR